MKKLLAAAAAAALALHAMSAAAFAVTVEGAPKTLETAWASQWCQFSLGEDAAKEDYIGYTVTFTVQSDCDYDADNNMVAKVYSANNDAEGNPTDLIIMMAEDGKTEYTNSFTISESNIDLLWQDWGAAAFQFQCGHLAPVELVSVTAENAAAPGTTEPETTVPEVTSAQTTAPEATSAQTTAPAATSAQTTTGAAGNVNGTGDKNQPTGLIIAVLPAASAAAAVLIAKKRK